MSNSTIAPVLTRLIEIQTKIKALERAKKEDIEYESARESEQLYRDQLQGTLEREQRTCIQLSPEQIDNEGMVVKPTYLRIMSTKTMHPIKLDAALDAVEAGTVAFLRTYQLPKEEPTAKRPKKSKKSEKHEPRGMYDVAQDDIIKAIQTALRSILWKEHSRLCITESCERGKRDSVEVMTPPSDEIARLLELWTVNKHVKNCHAAAFHIEKKDIDEGWEEIQKVLRTSAVSRTLPLEVAVLFRLGVDADSVRVTRSERVARTTDISQRDLWAIVQAHLDVTTLIASDGTLQDGITPERGGALVQEVVTPHLETFFATETRTSVFKVEVSVEA